MPKLDDKEEYRQAQAALLEEAMEGDSASSMFTLSKPTALVYAYGD